MTGIATGKIARRNELRGLDGYMYSKLLLRLALIYSAAFIVGIFAYYLLDFPFTEKINIYIASHFTDAFRECTGFSEYLESVLAISMTDITHLFYIFVSGFTMFASFALCGIIAYRGISLGFAVGYLVNAIKCGVISYSHTTLLLCVFLLSNALIASAIMSLSSKALVFTDDFRRLYGRKRLIIKSKALYRHIYYLLVIFGGVIIINFLRLFLNRFLL